MAASDTMLGAGAKKSPALFVVDVMGTVIGWTAPAEELTGYRSEEIVGRSGRLLLMPGRTNLWSGRLHDQERWHGLAELRHRDGDRLLVRVEGARLATRLAGQAWLLSAVPADEDLSGKTGSLLESLINSFPVAMAIWDRDLRCVWRNAEAERLTEGFPYYRIGQSMADQIPGTDSSNLLEVMRRVLKDGVPIIDRESRWTSADQNEERMLSSSISRLDGVDGRPLGVCTLVLDITDSRARDRLHLLREASIRVGTTLDVRRTAQELAELAVPALADFVCVDLGESVLPDTTPLQRLATEPEPVRIPAFRRAGLASVHEGVPEARWHLNDAVFIRQASPFSHVVATGRTHYEPVIDFSPGSWLDHDPERAGLMRATGMHTLLIMPLKARGDVLGVTVFARTDNKEPFTRDDLMLAEELAARAALSLDNARRYTRERNTALALQRDLLPRVLSGGDALEVASRYLPSDVHEGVGGDWFDVIRLPDGGVALVVGDVTGHGINAAATMGRMRTAVRTLAYMGLRPHEVLTHLDQLIVRLAEEDDSPTDPTVATCLYALYDPATRRCLISRAGHPPPALLLPSGEVTFPDIPGGTPIGVGLGSFESLELELEPGTVLALYTDGLIETREDDLEAGMHRLGVALAAAPPPLERLCASVISSMLGGTPAEDDIALLVARTR
ncbi:SpoIIE family protein phosphatase [Nonomuraea salmonea]|uniref:SpoIIE family protein phosphatase n=1 Tax=Nonomuraea salmonea TaxID=46181 RepID=A0ABV5NIB6_9ACTN